MYSTVCLTGRIIPRMHSLLYNIDNYYAYYESNYNEPNNQLLGPLRLKFISVLRIIPHVYLSETSTRQDSIHDFDKYVRKGCNANDVKGEVYEVPLALLGALYPFVVRKDLGSKNVIPME